MNDSQIIEKPSGLNSVSSLGNCSGPDRILAPLGEGFGKLQLQLDKLQRVGWIQDLAAPGGWDVMGTFTYRWAASLASTMRTHERFMNRKLPGVSYFYAIEENPSRDGHHVHSLWTDCSGVFRREVWADWFKRYGIALIEPVRSKGDSADYASKYLCKPNAWYNIKLQWHRMQRLKGSEYSLT